MLPSIAKAARMNTSRLIGLRESIAGVALLVGPGIAGILVAALEPVTVMWITSGIAALAALLTLGIPRRASALPQENDEDAPARERAGSVFHGLRIIVRTPLLRMLVLLNLSLAVVLAATQGMVIPVHFAFQDQAQYVGFVLSALAAGLLIGGGLFAALGDRIPRRVWFGVGVGVLAVGFVVIGTLGPVWSIFMGAAIVGIGGGSMNAVVGLTFVENIDDAQRGKVLGAQNAIITLVPAVGIGGAAVLIEVGSLQITTAVLAALWIAAATACLLSPRIRHLGKGRP